MARRRARSGAKAAVAEASATTSGPAAVPVVVVGLGASAGGLEAVQRLLARVPDDSGLSFVLVLMLRRDARQLARLVARQTRMRVELVQAPTRVEAGSICIVPPGLVPTIEEGTLSVHPEDDTPTRSAIDTFFRSLAEDQGECAVGVVLSGSGSDGTAGLRAIREQGGLTLAQAPETAGDPSLPQAAIGAGLVDVVVPPERMASRILDHRRAVARSRSLAAETQDADLRARKGELCRILELRTGHDLSGYQEEALVRRLRRRLLIHDAPSVAAYALLLAQDPAEPDRLLRDLLVGVTRFFRDREAFLTLAAKALPAIVGGDAAEAPVRVWVPGCASGEEAYSIAMLVREAVENAGRPRPIQIFATDIDTELLAAARKGRFPGTIAADVSKERLARFFLRDESGYVAAQALRETCLFSRHSLVRDPPFSNLDLISCRNVLTYLEPDLQKKLVPLLHYALRPGGHLFLGAAEGLDAYAELFEPVEERHRLFRRADGATPRALFPLSAGRLGFIPATGNGEARQEGGRPASQRRLAAAFERTVLDEYAPPCALVNAGGDILALAGRIGRYFHPPPGSLTTNLVEVVPAGMRQELRLALQEAGTGVDTVVREGLAVEAEGALRRVRLSVRPAVPTGAAGGSGLYVVVFQDAGLLQGAADAAAVRRGQQAGVERLESELRATQVELRGTTQELETTLEALRSAGEELAAVREHLESTDEELLTSQEELRILNEELATLHSQLGRNATAPAVAGFGRRRGAPSSRAARLDERRPG